jgi:hypothetical protein
VTIAIEDISMTEQLDREALTAVRGGVGYLPTPSPWEVCLPEFPSFPSGFPFTGCSPVAEPEPKLRLVDPENPLLQ